MPNWKKVIVSGSSANLYELHVDSSITASIVSASQLTGSLFGTASWAVSSSCALFAITASYIETAQTASYVKLAQTASSVSPLFQNVLVNTDNTSSFIGDAHNVIINNGAQNAALVFRYADNQSTEFGIYNVDNVLEILSAYHASEALFTISGVTGDITAKYNISASAFYGTASQAISSSYALSASYAANVPATASYALQALSSSYALTASFASAFADQGYPFTQSPGSNTWNINHNLNTLTPLVDVYDSTYNQLIPASVTSIDANNTRITFSTAQAGFAIISKGSGISSQSAISASFATTASYALTAASASLAATASHADVFTIGGSQMMYSNTPSTSAGNNGIFATSTGSFAGAFYQYTLYSGSNARSENANVVWTSTTSSYTNYSTIDVGNTSGVVGSVVITGGQVQLNILTPTAGWTVRAVATFV